MRERWFEDNELKLKHVHGETWARCTTCGHHLRYPSDEEKKAYADEYGLGDDDDYPLGLELEYVCTRCGSEYEVVPDQTLAWLLVIFLKMEGIRW